ncbi:integral membrane sensor signal transduction histidine kinase [Calothrix parasitica NIES-267]|uniref:histidine kinase n=1 Tax=Calothrix parasitica NIES-267 TaxID=1973488 RepID=A0A1Z4LV74_9CYAN|nr:integral membrane sensor signal transduction histidine kinase [Calothrix parasitica NIES-267]
MFQATRRRLAIWYTAIMAVLLLLFASGVYLYVRNTLIDRIDDTLNHVVEVIERSLVIEAVNSNNGQFNLNLEASFRDNADTRDDDRIDLEWFSPTGQLLWSTLSEPLDIPIHPNRMGETVRVVQSDGEKRGRGDKETGRQGKKVDAFSEPMLLRQVTERVEVGRQVLGYLRVSHPWFEVTKPSRDLIVDLALGISWMLFSVGASGWFLSGKAMEPVRESYQHLKQFTADASHELRSPIALIQTNVQVALDELKLTQSQGDNVEHYQQQFKLIERLTQRLGKLVNDLLFLARQDSGISAYEFSSCPIDALLMEVFEEQQLLASSKNIALWLHLIDSPQTQSNPELLEDWFTSMGNWEQLARLFTNLISNALRYTSENGKVKVELARLEVVNRSVLQVKIEDNGIGIPPEALPRLFDRFYRVDPARSHRSGNSFTQNTAGSGLGLPISKAIIENHQGQIQIESILGKGTTVTVTLPIIPGS